ncbi:hypothetical protein BH24ACT5_BH24ACT5_02160 [soil metagenome]
MSPVPNRPRWASAVRSSVVSTIAIAALPVGVALVASVRWAGALVADADRGLDVSDEAFYLVSAHRPDDALATVSDFGFYLQPLLWLVGGSLKYFRIAGLGLLLLASAMAALVALGPIVHRMSSKLQVAGALVSAAALMWAATLTYYGLWLPTPSYNLLNVVLMLLVAASLIGGSRALVDVHDVGSALVRPRHRAVWPLTALGALLVLGASIKVSSYLAAALVCAACIAVVAGRHLLLAVRATAVGALAGIVVHWGLIAGPPTSDVRRLWRGAQALDLLKSHSPSVLWQNDYLLDTVAPWFGALALGIVGMTVAWSYVRSCRARTTVVVALAAVAFVAMWGRRPHGGPPVLSDDTGWWWVRTGALALVGVTALAPRRSRVLIVGPCVMLLGVAAGAGSNAGIVRQIGLTVGLVALGVLTQAVAVWAMLDRSHHRLMAAIPGALFFVLASVTSMGVIVGAREHPYRLGLPLEESDRRVDLGRFGTVWVAPDTALYITQLQALSAGLSEAERQCFIDLTGGTPVSAIALDARPAGAAWLIGGYEGSADAADYLLTLDECVAGPIALLEAPGGVRSIPRPEWLSDREFRTVGHVEFHGYLDETQVLSVAADDAGGGL